MAADSNESNEQVPNADDQNDLGDISDDVSAGRDESQSPTGSKTPIPFEIEPDEKSRIQDLDVCPNCGAPLTGDDSVVCMRCGFDLRTLQKLETQHAVADLEDEVEPAEAIAPSAKPRVFLSYALIAVAWGLLLVGYVYGVRALFPGIEPKVTTSADGLTEQYISWDHRFLGIIKALVITGAWTACAIAGLALFGRLVERPLGRVKLALIHVVAIISTMQLARYIHFQKRSIEWTLESALQMILFLLLSLALLKLTRRDVITYALITVLLVLFLHFGSGILAWAAG